MKEFFHYFFGKGDTVEFEAFTLAHLLPILFGCLVVFLIFKFRNKIAESKHENTIRIALGFLLLFCEMSYYWRMSCLSELGGNAEEHLPIAVCQWAIIFLSVALFTKNQTLFDIGYFFVFSGTIFALITPTVITYTGPTRFRYYQFWGEHLFGYFAVFYLIFVNKFKVNIKSVIKSYIAIVIMVIIATFVNNLLGGKANYLFMAQLEETDSLLNILPKNYFLKMLVMGGVVTVLYFLAYLPWFLKEKKLKKLNTTN